MIPSRCGFGLVGIEVRPQKRTRNARYALNIKNAIVWNLAPLRNRLRRKALASQPGQSLRQPGIAANGLLGLSQGRKLLIIKAVLNAHAELKAYLSIIRKHFFQ